MLIKNIPCINEFSELFICYACNNCKGAWKWIVKPAKGILAEMKIKKIINKTMSKIWIKSDKIIKRTLIPIWGVQIKSIHEENWINLND